MMSDYLEVVTKEINGGKAPVQDKNKKRFTIAIS